MADTLNVVLAPQFVINITHEMGDGAGFTIVAGIASTVPAGGGIEYTQTEKDKLAAIEASATADQSDAQIKTAYENNADTNVFNDLAEAKLGDIEDDATADQTGAEIKSAYQSEANAFTDAQFTKLAGVATGADVSPTPLSNAQIKTQYELNGDTNAFTDLAEAKLGDIEADATADQTAAEIETGYNAQVAKISAGEITAGTEATVRRVSPADLKAIVLAHETGGGGGDPNPAQVSAQEIIDGTETALRSFSPDDVEAMAVLHGGGGGGMSDAQVKTAYENNANTNEFDDAEQTKLAGIETAATADMTGAEIKTAYQAEANAFTDAKNTKLTGIETSATADQTNAEIEAAYNAQVSQISTPEIIAGTEGTVRRVAPDDLVAMIVAHAPAAIADAHYQDPVADIAELVALPEAGLVDAERRFVEVQVADYFYDIDAASGDEAPTDQTGGTGFWITVPDGGGGASPAQIKSKYEKNANTNAFEDAEKTSLGTMEDNATADQSDAEIATAYGNEVAQVSGGEITAGTEAALRTYSPADVKAMVDAHAPGGGTPVNFYSATNHTMVIGDAEGIVEMSSTANRINYIPLNSTVDFPVGTIINVVKILTGDVTITAVAGVTLNGTDGGSKVLEDVLFAGVTLYQRSTNNWVAHGQMV